MKDILTAPFVKEMCDTTANMYRLGWDERNGGRGKCKQCFSGGKTFQQRLLL